jgi:hypothetical protein
LPAIGPSLPPYQSTSMQPCSARAVAVWPDIDPQNTRVAICGETYEEAIPLERYTTQSTTGQANGFIAVYDGNGNMLWTHHLYGDPATGGASAVTDLCVRREGLGVGEVPRDVVTYCGISTYGTPSSGPLMPVRPFEERASNESGGDTNLGVAQWDGFVGRVTFTYNGGAFPKQVQFHSTVGGPGQDGLFGIAELSKSRFAVVGSARTGGLTNAFPGSGSLPFAGQYDAGVVAVFNAQPVASGAKLILEGVRVLGAYPTSANPQYESNLFHELSRPRRLGPRQLNWCTSVARRCSYDD